MTRNFYLKQKLRLFYKQIGLQNMTKKYFKQQLRLALKQNGLQAIYLQREYYENCDENNSNITKIGLSNIEILKCFNSVIATKITHLYNKQK
jgi:hypothetical protein